MLWGMGRRLLVAACLLGALAPAWACSSYPSVEGDPIPLPKRSSRADASSDGEAPPPEEEPPPVELDAGLDATDSGDAARGPLRAFVSSALKNGNLGGLAGADALCTQHANAQGFQGNFRAWLSVNGTNAIDRITSDGPWQRVDGQVVAATRAELASGQLRAPLVLDEKGAAAPAVEDRVWTATGANGQYAGPDCGQWTGAGTGRVGEAAHVNAQWTSLVDEACSEVNRVYCFQL